MVMSVSVLCLIDMTFSFPADKGLYLYSGMLNLILFFQKILNTPKQHIVIIWRIKLYM